jgi:rhodanese-related sulfurtransferase
VNRRAGEGSWIDQEGYRGASSPTALEIDMRRLFLGFAFALFLAFAASAQSSEPALAPSISASELSARRALSTAPVVIDVRTPEEFARGHIPGAVNISWEEPERIAALDAPNGVALYCMVGPRARKGEAALLAIGVDEVLHVEGGLAAWMSAGLPVAGAN